MLLSSVRGFTVIEAIVALAIVTGGVLTLAGLARQVTDTVARSRRHLSAAVRADASVAMRIAGPLVATPPGCVDRDTSGCMEALDGDGGATTAAPAFIRRWRVVPVGSAPAPAWSLSVCVVPVDLRNAAPSAAGACVHRIVSEVAP